MKYFAVFLLLCGCAFAEQKPRVFITDHDSFEMSSHFAATDTAAAGAAQAGVRRVNTEQVRNLNQACPAITIVGGPETADYVVVWDTKTWNQTSWTGHQNEFGIYNKNRELVKSGAAHKLSNAAKEICKAIPMQEASK